MYPNQLTDEEKKHIQKQVIALYSLGYSIAAAVQHISKQYEGVFPIDIYCIAHAALVRRNYIREMELYDEWERCRTKDVMKSRKDTSQSEPDFFGSFLKWIVI